MSEERAPKPQRLRSLPRALCFAVSLPLLQAVARNHGYALAVHGSMATDLDLVAVPWVDDADDAEVLVEALRVAVNGWIRNDPNAYEHDYVNRNPEPKPHGRRAWSIYIGEGAIYLDVSVMPRECDRGAPR